MSIDPSKARSIFTSAVENHPPDQWGRFLDDACGEDAKLRRRVELLLKAHQGEDSFLDRGEEEDDPADATIDQPITEKPGTVIGPYKLLQQIGEGGFGVVFMADQREPIKRRVALKIIKPGMDTRQVIARFEAERQALAMMDHPNIAKVFGAGTTESGRPYFVMELIKGIPITQYCDEKQLTPRQRLELFVPVCQALQHAHQKGIIHRDIKPSNVLVAKYDDRPVPKVIDFGVVKAIEQHLTEKTMFTQFGQIVGTVDYMSPEQADLNQLDIDTRSDIYSLGVLLYELLTGATPFDRQRLRAAAFDELLRIIREEEPPKPSLRLSTSASLPSIAANRHTEPRKLSTLVRGELDWIVMKALEKDRTRRYETANGFANDIQRYLNDEAVVACPPSARYRFRKFARRNKLALAIGSVAAAVLIVGIAGLAASNALVSRQRDAKDRALGELNVAFQEKDQALQRAETNFNLAMEALDEVYIKSIGRERLLLTGVKNRSRQNLRRQIPLTEQEQRLLGQGLEFYVQFAEQNADNPDARFEVGQAYKRVAKLQLNLGKRDAAAAALQQASDSLTRLSADYPDQAYFVEELAEVYQTMASIQGGQGSLRTAVQLFSKALALDPQDAGLYEKRAGVHTLMHQTEEALADYRRCLELDPDDASCHKKLARLYKSNGDVKQAIVHFQRSLELDPNEASCHTDLADLLLGAAGHMPDSDRLALRHAREAVRLEEGNPEFQKILIRALIRAGENAEALAYAKRASESDPTGASHGLLVDAYVALGDLEQALAAANQSVQYYQQLIAESPDNQYYRIDLGNTLCELAGLLDAMKRIPEAEKTYERALAVFQKAATDFPDWPSARVEVQTAYYHLGTLFERTNRIAEAEQLFRDALEVIKALSADFPENIDYPVWVMHRYGDLVRCLNKQEKFTEALDYAKQASESDPTEDVYGLLVNVYVELGDLDQALATANRGIQLHPHAQIYKARGNIYQRLERNEEALADYAAALQRFPQDGVDTEVYYERARIYHQQGRYQQAMDNLDQIMLAGIHRSWVYFRRAEVCLQLGDYQQTLDDLETYQEMASEDTGFLAGFAAKQVKASQDDSIRQKLLLLADKILVSGKQPVQSHLARAHILDGLEMHEQAAEEFTAAAALVADQSPAAANSYFLLGDHLFHRNQYEQALPFMDRAIGLNPTYSEAYDHRGWIHLDLGKPEQARIDFYLAIKTGTAKGAGMYEGHGVASLHLGNKAAASADFTRVVELQPGYYTSYKQALVRLGTSDLPGYRADCTSMLEQFADTEDLNEANFTAWTCALAPWAVDDYTPAIALAKAALAGHPKSSAHLEKLGAILYRAGDIEQALKWLAEADRQMPDPSESRNTSPAYTWFFLAMVEHHLGNEQEATAWLEKATAWSERALDKADGDVRTSWNRGLTLMLLHKETDALLAASAPDADSPNPNDPNPDGPAPDSPVPDDQESRVTKEAGHPSEPRSNANNQPEAGTETGQGPEKLVLEEPDIDP